MAVVAGVVVIGVLVVIVEALAAEPALVIELVVVCDDSWFAVATHSKAW